MSTYDSIEDYSADVEAARDAYRADELVRDGLCETGCGRPREISERRRKCWTCAHPDRNRKAET